LSLWDKCVDRSKNTSSTWKYFYLHQKKEFWNKEKLGGDQNKLKLK